MDTDEAKVKKEDLEIAILKLIRDYEKETHFTVQDIFVDKTKFVDGHLETTNITARVEVA